MPERHGQPQPCRGPKSDKTTLLRLPRCHRPQTRSGCPGPFPSGARCNHRRLQMGRFPCPWCGPLGPPLCYAGEQHRYLERVCMPARYSCSSGGEGSRVAPVCATAARVICASGSVGNALSQGDRAVMRIQKFVFRNRLSKVYTTKHCDTTIRVFDGSQLQCVSLAPQCTRTLQAAPQWAVNPQCK